MKKQYFISATACLIGFLLSLHGLLAQTKASRKDWIQLFNGRDLAGWDVKIAGYALNNNFGNTFRVENGVLKIAYDQYASFDDKFGHLYYKQPYSYYILRFEYRFTGNQLKGGAAWNVRNSGIMIHSQSARSMPKDQGFPVSLEVQLLGGLGAGERHTANLCTPGTIVEMNGKINPAHCIDSDSKTYHGDQWVTAEAIVLGDSVVHHVVAGDTVLTYHKPRVGGGYVSADYNWQKGHVTNYQEWIKKEGTLLKEGYLALQAESHPIEFRKVELLNLKGCTNPKCANYKPYYISADDNCQCNNKP